MRKPKLYDAAYFAAIRAQTLSFRCANVRSMNDAMARTARTAAMDAAQMLALFCQAHDELCIDENGRDCPFRDCSRGCPLHVPADWCIPDDPDEEGDA